MRSHGMANVESDGRGHEQVWAPRNPRVVVDLPNTIT